MEAVISGGSPTGQHAARDTKAVGRFLVYALCICVLFTDGMALQCWLICCDCFQRGSEPAGIGVLQPMKNGRAKLCQNEDL